MSGRGTRGILVISCTASRTGNHNRTGYGTANHQPAGQAASDCTSSTCRTRTCRTCTSSTSPSSCCACTGCTAGSGSSCGGALA